MRALGIAVVAVLAVGSGSPPHDDGAAPRHMVAFVVGDCPPGWEPDTLTPGRVIVGTDEMTAVGRVVGTPLAAEENRSHGHGMATSAVSLSYKSISAADGSNNQGAAAGAQPINGSVAEATSGLPFVQLQACVSP